MKKYFLAALLLLLGGLLFPQDLPHKLTDAEKEQMKTYLPFVSPLGFTTPPASPVRTMAEWEELEGLMIAWTSYTSILRQIVKYAQEECFVYIVCSDSNSVKTFLQNGGVPLTNLKFIVAPFNSVWCRDYGPWSVYSNTADSLYIIDWIYNRPRANDDAIPSVFANQQGLPLYQTTTAPYNLIHTGGNFMADGNGTGFSSKLIINENPSHTNTSIDTIMKKFMGISRYIKMETLPYDQIHHIDMHLKLLDEETLLVGQYPAGIADGPQIEANLQYVLNNFKTCYGRDYKVVRIPMPPDAQGRYPSNSGDYRTFTNSAIINKTVIVPTYELKHDTTALRIYREAMPGYRVVGIDCNQTIPSLGAIHCIVKEIGAREPVFISHAPIRSQAGLSDPFLVKAYIKSRSGISGATLWWSADTALGYNAIPMSSQQADTFLARIPQQPYGTKVFYYLSALSNSGRSIVKPLTAPRGAYRFTVDSSPCANVNAADGWNIISVPMQAANMTGAVLFPQANSPAFGFSNGYQSVSTLETGKGYWLRFPGVFSIPVCGANVSASVPLNAGWNLIGVYSQDIPTASINTTPAGILTSQFYGYSGGYVPASTLQAGKGYWVRAAQSGSMNFPAVYSSHSISKVTPLKISSANEIVIRDIGGNSTSLYLLKDNFTEAVYDLPPRGPQNIFDVRFASQRYAEALSKGFHTVSITGGWYPLSLMSMGSTLRVRDKATGGNLLNTATESGKALLIADPAITEIEISAEQLPLQFSLQQNFPNPFNPSTTIAFELPEKASTSLTVYNQLGECVAVLINKEMPEGSHRVEWNASAVPAGVYLYELKTDSRRATGKSMLMK